MPVITEDAIRGLATFKGAAPVTSCYLDVDGRRLLRQQDIEHELDTVLRGARARNDGSAPVRRDLERIERFVKDGFDRSRTRGLAMFSCSDPELWHVVPLPVPVRTRVVVNSQPAVGELKSVVEQYDRFGVLLVDKQRARMFVFELGELVEHSEHVDELPRDYDLRGHSERGDRSSHVDALADQHARNAAGLAWSVFQRVGFDRFTAAAPEELVPHLRDLLHPYLRERYCGGINVSPTASLDDIRHAAADVEARVERDKEAELVGRLRDAVGTGKGASGLPDTLAALAEHRVDTLLVSQGYAVDGWRCGSCKLLAAKGRACSSCGAEMHAVSDVVEEAVETALMQSCRVEICVDNADLDVAGRIGALLRY